MQEISFLQSYGFVMMDDIGGFFVGSSWVLGILMFVAIAVKFLGYDDVTEAGHKVINKAMKCMIPLFVVFAFLGNITPTTKQAAAIIAIPVIANDEQARELPKKVLDVGSAWIDELTPENLKEVAASAKDGVTDAAKEIIEEAKK